MWPDFTILERAVRFSSKYPKGYIAIVYMGTVNDRYGTREEVIYSHWRYAGRVEVGDTLVRTYNTHKGFPNGYVAKAISSVFDSRSMRIVDTMGHDQNLFASNWRPIWAPEGFRIDGYLPKTEGPASPPWGRPSCLVKDVTPTVTHKELVPGQHGRINVFPVQPVKPDEVAIKFLGGNYYNLNELKEIRAQVDEIIGYIESKK